MADRLGLRQAVGRLATGLAVTLLLLVPSAYGKSAMTAFDFAFNSIEGEAMPLAQFKGSVLLVVNTASFCGYTPQFRELEALSRKYADKGLIVIGVPSNDFGQQDPGSNTEIKQFCEANFSVDFPMTEKQKVVGSEAHPLFKWLAESLGDKGVPRWNFHKFLIDRAGAADAAWPSSVSPDAPELVAEIEKVLADEKIPGE